MSVINNKILIYLGTRYLTYGLQFLLSLVIAAKLGPYYLGVYGLIQLILNYFEQLNFGIPHSLNVLLVHNKITKDVQDRYTLNSLFIFTCVNLIVFLSTILLYFKGNIQWGEYSLDKYLFLVVFIAMSSYYNNTLTMVARFRNRVNVLSIVGSIPVIANLIVVWFFSKEELVQALVWTNLVSCLIVTAIFYYIGVIPTFNIQNISVVCQKEIVKKGLYLFIYNSCFYFILIGVRTLISKNYTVEEFGYFTFSFTIANAVMLLLSSLNTIIFPKTIDLMSNGDNEEKRNVIQKLRIGYITTAHFMVYFALILFPIITCVFQSYKPAITSMNLIALAVLMNTNSYGYITLLIAQNKERLTSRLSLIAFLISLSLGIILIYLFKVEFSYVIISVMVAYLIFSYLGYYEGEKQLKGKPAVLKSFVDFFPIRLSVPFSISVIISILKLEYIIFVPLLLFLILNFKDFKLLKSMVLKMIKNPNVIDV